MLRNARPDCRFVCLLLVLTGAGCASDHRSAAHTPTNASAHADRAFIARARTGRPAPDYWQQQADYVIDVSLDAEAKKVSMVCRIRYTNNSPDELHEVWLNLEQNLFRPDSLGAKRTPGGARYGHEGEFVGGFEIARVDGFGQALTLEVQDTIGRISLPSPIPARGGTAEFTIEASFLIPVKGSDRMGITSTPGGPIFQVAQWFPNVCKYDDVQGWNTLGYLGQGEFYTDFGTYDVRLTVPSDHVVAATGELENGADVLSGEEVSRLSQARSSREPVAVVTVDEVGARVVTGATRTWRFKSERTRTFAWASSPTFVWDACSADAGDGHSVLCQSFYPKESARTWGMNAKGGGATRMTRQAVEHYGRTWMAYPYPTMSNVQGDVAGMEYPMVIFCEGAHGERDLWDVTSHEISHTWFPMMVNSDERRHAWMDEGLTTFMNTIATQERYGKDEGPTGEPAGARAFADSHSRPMSQCVMTLAEDIEPDQYSELAYDKPAVGLRVLREAVMGPERFDEAFREYIRRWSFKSPQPEDFFRTIDEYAGEDLSWWWEGWFSGREVMDQRVAGVRDGQPPVVMLEEAGGVRGPIEMVIELGAGTTREAKASANVWTVAGSTGGARERREWRAEIPVEGVDGRQVRSVTLDPRKVLPDVEPRNNEWRR